MNQTAICRFTVAVNDRKRNQQTGEWEDNASFIPIVVFGKQAENCDRYLAKGRKVAVSGRIQTGSYTNKEGNKVYTTEVIANNVEFLGGGNQQSGQGRGQGYGQNQGFDNNGGFGFGQGGFNQNQQAPQGGFQQSEAFDTGSAQQDSAQDIPEGFQALQDDDIPF
jgi:single-strand DNA-binding protein